MKISYIPYDGTEINDKAFAPKYDSRWTNVLKKKLESEGHEIHTYDILPVEKADAILCFDNVYYQNNHHFIDLKNANKLGSTTHIDYEPPSANCKIHNDKGLKLLSHLFKSLITYNDNVINGSSIVKGCIGDYYSNEIPYNNDFESRKLVTIVANFRVGLLLDKPHKYELYSKRGEAVLFFQDKCKNDFDLYGNYWPETHVKRYIGPIKKENKIATLSKYKFVLSFDSITHQNGYISEKIFDCFKAKTIPIYWGADNITEYIPKDCFIDFRDFLNYDDLLDYIRGISKNQYEKKIRAIEEYLKSEIYLNLFSSEGSANIIYKELMKPKRKLNSIIVNIILKSFENKRLSNIKYNYDNNYCSEKFPQEISIINFEIDKDYPSDHYIILKMKVHEKNKFEIYARYNDVFDRLKLKGKRDGGSKYIDYYLKIRLKEIMYYPKYELYIQNNTTSNKRKLAIVEVANFSGFGEHFSVFIKDNYFYYADFYRKIKQVKEPNKLKIDNKLADFVLFIKIIKKIKNVIVTVSKKIKDKVKLLAIKLIKFIIKVFKKIFKIISNIIKLPFLMIKQLLEVFMWWKP